jgi:hypothetical protein
LRRLDARRLAESGIKGAADFGIGRRPALGNAGCSVLSAGRAAALQGRIEQALGCGAGISEHAVLASRGDALGALAAECGVGLSRPQDLLCRGGLYASAGKCAAAGEGVDNVPDTSADGAGCEGRDGGCDGANARGRQCGSGLVCPAARRADGRICAHDAGACGHTDAELCSLAEAGDHGAADSDGWDRRRDVAGNAARGVQMGVRGNVGLLARLNAREFLAVVAAVSGRSDAGLSFVGPIVQGRADDRQVVDEAVGGCVGAGLRAGALGSRLRLGHAHFCSDIVDGRLLVGRRKLGEVVADLNALPLDL